MNLVIRSAPSSPLFLLSTYPAPSQGFSRCICSKCRSSHIAKSVVQVGPILITHRGLSGPAILRASAWDARELAKVNYQFTAEINWLGGNTPAQIRHQLQEFRKERAVKKLKHNPFSELPKRLWEKLIELSGNDSGDNLGASSQGSDDQVAQSIDSLSGRCLW